MSRIGVLHEHLLNEGLIPHQKHTYNNGGRNKGIKAQLRAIKRHEAEVRQENERAEAGMRRMEELCRRENIGPATERALNVARKVLKPETFDKYLKKWLSVDGPGVDF